MPCHRRLGGREAQGALRVLEHREHLRCCSFTSRSEPADVPNLHAKQMRCRGRRLRSAAAWEVAHHSSVGLLMSQSFQQLSTVARHSFAARFCSRHVYQQISAVVQRQGPGFLRLRALVRTGGTKGNTSLLIWAPCFSETGAGH